MTDLVDAAQCSPTEVAEAIEGLDRLGLVVHTVQAGHRRLLTVEPMTPHPTALPRRRPFLLGSVVLSRFAVIHREEATLIIESPLSNFRARLDDPEAAGLLVRLAAGVEDSTSEEPGAQLLGAASVGSLCAETVRAYLEVLVHAGLAITDGDETDPRATAWENCSPEAAGWSVHDLLFHARSRPGAHDRPVGGNYPLQGRFSSLPVTPAPRGSRLPLPDVDIDRIASQDPPFTVVLGRRRSTRWHGEAPITIEALGEFLFRTARMIEFIPRDPGAGIRYDASRRPYPSAGGAYELELYPIVSRCDGLAAGVYHYVADAHALEQLEPFNRRAGGLVRDAADATELDGEPQVLLVVTSRIARVAWKYSGMAYATTLKNVGVLYQTMYLVAAAMNLAACAVGTGNSMRVASTLGCSHLEEPSVGESLLGTSGCASGKPGATAKSLQQSTHQAIR